MQLYVAAKSAPVATYKQTHTKAGHDGLGSTWRSHGSISNIHIGISEFNLYSLLHVY